MMQAGRDANRSPAQLVESGPLNSTRTATVSLRRPAQPQGGRVRARSKFLFAGDRKIHIKGVTYGTFRPDAHGNEFADWARVERDFAAIAANGGNTVRVYAIPPRWLLDLAFENGLYVMVGLPWEQHVAFLDDPERTESIVQRVREGAGGCAGHPAVLCYAIGNEIPASIVRWHGQKRIQQFLRRLYLAVKQEDPEALVTYVNYPTTEYLDLPFLDLVCFNVYLESRERLEAYLSRLHVLAGERPLLLAEVGLDSRRNGELTQAQTLSWQIESIFARGCCGLVVFAWTDEWHRGGEDIEDWDFGLTTRSRRPKPALAAVRETFAETPFPSRLNWPSVSVVVCSYNGSGTIDETLVRLAQLDYPSYEVIVVDDGSTDSTAEIVRGRSAKLISGPNAGLSAARNRGLEAASGEIVAYIDDDAYPDRDWLRHLAYSFLSCDYAAVGAPNFPPDGDGLVADAVSASPGGPIHVLVSDSEAEHIPGCNMAVRRDRLLSVGGFDPQFRAAGDDVDLCWRLIDRGWKIGFNPAAVVWHHRRNSVSAYWKQQVGYGKAEALLEKKWPRKYDALGHVAWNGRIYSDGKVLYRGWGRDRLYQGTWGLAPFQRLYSPEPNRISGMTQTPEWHLVILALFIVSALGLLWRPLFGFAPLLAVAVAAPLAETLWRASQLTTQNPGGRRLRRWARRILTVLLHMLQPLARLTGRMGEGLNPWRLRAIRSFHWPLRNQGAAWSEKWREPAAWLNGLQKRLESKGATVRVGADYDSWDLEVRGGLCGGAKLLMGLEEHGAGRQMIRFQIWPVWSPVVIAVVAICAVLAFLATLDEAHTAALSLGLIALLPSARAFYENALACGLMRLCVHEIEPEAESAVQL